MNKIKKLTLFVLTAYLLLQTSLISFAQESANDNQKYPDYSYEFVGKDKCENFNRKMYIFNAKLNKFVIRPVNIVWASIVPKYGMERIENIYTNAEYPKRLVSTLVQGKFKDSGKETARFLVNSSIGLGGMYDPAKKLLKMESKDEDSEKILSHYKIKKGPYIVLPIISHGNLRNLFGKALDYGLDPSSYVIGPITSLVKAGSYVNKTCSLQPLIEAISSTYADPYDVTKKLYGIESYIKNADGFSKEVTAEKISMKDENKLDYEVTSTPIELSEIKNTNEPTYKLTPANSLLSKNLITADVNLNNFDPQCPLVDSMRTAMFDVEDIYKSIWSEVSLWNRCFAKKLKTDTISVVDARQKYKFRYILQKDKNSPLAIIYPSIGEGVMSHHPAIMAKIFYDKGYSVVIQGSTFQWEFVKSMPKNYHPGIPAQDAEYARIVTGKIIDKLENEKHHEFGPKMLVGTSFGAITSLFVANKEETDNTLNISKYIAINPPIDVLYSLQQIDKNSQDWRSNSEDIRLRAASTAAKILNILEADENTQPKTEQIPFDKEEAKLIIGFIMKQKLSDVVFTIENCPQCRRSELYDTINNLSYSDYAKKYLLVNTSAPTKQIEYETSLYSIENFLKSSDKYKIYHAMDDYLVSTQQLAWLKRQTHSNSVIYNNGSHLGFLYRKEFIDSFKQDITLVANSTKKNLDLSLKTSAEQ